MLITIDGLCGLGKSTIGKRAAEVLGMEFISTGIIVRYAAYKVQEVTTAESDAESKTPRIIDSVRMEDALRVDSELLRSDSLTPLFGEITKPQHLERLYKITRDYCEGRSVILDGRDSFAIFPSADLMYYFESSLEKRIAIRMASKNSTRQECMDYFKARDAAERNILIPRSRLITLDSLSLGVDETVRRIVADAQSARA